MRGAHLASGDQAVGKGARRSSALRRLTARSSGPIKDTRPD